MAAAHVSMELGLKGPLTCPSTACASGNHALGEATEHIRSGRAEVMLAGGAEATVTRTGVAAFNAMRALSTRNESPAAASRPFDRGRDGFVMGEAGAILVLESLERARERGAEPYCEVLGYGLTGDAHHLTEPDPTGQAPAAAITMALGDARLEPRGRRLRQRARHRDAGRRQQRGPGAAAAPGRRGRGAHHGLVHEVDARPLPGRGGGVEAALTAWRSARG